VSTVPGALSGISLGGSSAAAPIMGAAAPEVGRNGASPAVAQGNPLDSSAAAASQAPPAYASLAPSAAASSSQVKVDQASPANDSGRPVPSAISGYGAGGGLVQPPDGSKGGPRTGTSAESTDAATDQAVRDGTLSQGGRSTGPSLILIGSIVCLGLGAGLFVVRRLARQ
jgi:hypothetical protein